MSEQNEQICVNCKYLKLLNKKECKLLSVEVCDDEIYTCVKNGKPELYTHPISRKEYLKRGSSKRCIDIFETPECKFKQKERGSRYNIKNLNKRKSEEKPFLGVELYKFLEKCKTLDLEYKVLFQLLFWSGRRCAEIIGRRNDKSNAIKKNQIDFKNGIIQDIEIVKKRDKEVLINNPIPNSLLKDLKELVKDKSDDDMIFDKSYFHYYKKFRRIFPGHAPHDLRASFACFFYEKNNNNILVVKQLLQHESIETSEIYLKGLLGQNYQKIIKDAFNAIKMDDIER